MKRPTNTCLDRSTLLAATLALLFSVTGWAQSPCLQDAARGALDFWAGEWRFVNDDGVEIGTSTVSKVLGGCAFQEDFTAGELRGRGLTFLIPETDDWEQHWVDSDGRVVRYRGRVRAARADFEGEHVDTDGRVQKARASYQKADSGSISYRLELSEDGGESWNLAFSGAYLPMSASTEATRSTRATPTASTRPTPAERVAASAEPIRAEPDRPAATRPAAPPPATKGVQAVTRAADLSELSAEQAAVQMASPMTLQLPLGALDKLPRGYAWSSEDTAYYVCQGASIRRVRVTPEKKGGKVRLKVDLALFSRRYSQGVSLAVALVPAQGDASEANSYASGSLKRAKVGRGNADQATNGFTEKSIQMELDQATFERLFAAEQRPKLEVTLSVL